MKHAENTENHIYVVCMVNLMQLMHTLSLSFFSRLVLFSILQTFINKSSRFNEKWWKFSRICCWLFLWYAVSCFLILLSCCFFIANTHTSYLARVSGTKLPCDIPESKYGKNNNLQARRNCFYSSNSHRIITLLFAGMIIFMLQSVNNQPAAIIRCKW